MKKLLSLYNVDNVPILIKPFFLLLSYFLGLAAFLYCRLISLTSSIKIDGDIKLINNQIHIGAFWHEQTWLYLCTFNKLDNQVWMNHPHWYMKPIHVMCELMGVSELILGSTGNKGKEAAEKLVERLKQGYSTTLIPDGPYGPALKAKKGILHISLASKLPIIPLRFKCSKYFRLRDWDSKIFPLPFSKIEIKICEMLIVKDALDLDKNLRLLEGSLT